MCLQIYFWDINHAGTILQIAYYISRKEDKYNKGWDDKIKTSMNNTLNV